MHRVSDDDFDGLVDLVREQQVAAINDAAECASGPDCPRCRAVRMRFAETVAHIKAIQDDLAHSIDQGDVPRHEGDGGTPDA